MDRGEFEVLRDLPNKEIHGDIVLKRANNSDYLEAEKVLIGNALKVEALMTVRWNPETDAKTINVHVVGVGPICRLDVDGQVHPPAGRHHKHSLVLSSCPETNLKRGVHDRDDLAGKSIEEVFKEFCRISSIEHNGKLRVMV